MYSAGVIASSNCSAYAYLDHNFAMQAFLVIHLCDKPNADSRFVDVLIGIEVNFFLLEGADETFGIPVLPRTPPTGAGL